MNSIDKLKMDLVTGRISRRVFLQGATALGISAAAVPGLARQAYAQTPKKGGTLRLGIGHGSTTD
ncbi:MAG: twin-arginine translocation signal domain-containing protein, partial [Rhodovibrionaceae bacterium]